MCFFSLYSTALTLSLLLNVNEMKGMNIAGTVSLLRGIFTC